MSPVEDPGLILQVQIQAQTPRHLVVRAHLNSSLAEFVSSSIMELVGGGTLAELAVTRPTVFNGSNCTSASGGCQAAPDYYYRHNSAMTAVYCVAYLLVFAVGLVGNCFVIAVVFRSPRMRTVTNFFIVNLAVADILVIVFCLPATLMSNVFVRKYILP